MEVKKLSWNFMEMLDSERFLNKKSNNILEFGGESMKRRRFFGFDDIDKIFEEMMKRMEEMMEGFTEIDEKKLEEFLRDPNAKVYGYSITIGPDGKPRIKEFGNIKPTIEAIEEGKEELMGAREPLTEVYKEKGNLKIVAEVPGVNKEDIKLSIVDDDLLEIKVDTASRKYYKKVKLPAIPDESKIKARYVNGILEVTIPIKKEKEKRKEIKVE